MVMIVAAILVGRPELELTQLSPAFTVLKTPLAVPA